MAESQHLRLILHNFLSFHECKELEFIHKSCSTVGYRPNVFSTTLSHLIATNSAHLVMPFVPIREKLKEKVEEYFDCEYELFIEFTGLISWSRGASIGWHSDDNRPYLKQRDFSAVCYLNNYGDDFNGGMFRFQDGEPSSIIPSRGDVVIYTADNRNIHSVDEIIEGERLTLALWFSRDSSHDEDAKLLSLLSESLLHSSKPKDYSWLPLPASSNMYWFFPGHASYDQLGFDICWARLHVLGFDLLYSEDNNCYSDISDILMGPLRLARGNELFEMEFVNLLHALQVVQYYCWKASELKTTTDVESESSEVILLSESQQQRISNLKSLFSKDDHLAETVFSCTQQSFDWRKFVGAVAMWEDYVGVSYEGIVKSLPYWRKQQSIFNIVFDEK